MELSQGLAASESLERNGSLEPFSGNTSGPARRLPARDMSESSENHRFFFSDTRPRRNLSTRGQQVSQIRHAITLISDDPSSRSLSQELSSARSRKPPFSGSHRSNSPISHSPSSSFSQPNLSISISFPHPSNLSNGINGGSGSAGGNGKSAASLEKEIMHLQDMLKEREGEIALLEGSLKASESNTNGSAIAPPVLHIESGDGRFAMPTGDYSDCGSGSGRSTPVSSLIPPVSLSACLPRR